MFRSRQTAFASVASFITLIVVFAFVASVKAPTTAGQPTEAQPSFDYEDDRDHRRLAEVTFDVRHRAIGSEVVIKISAEGMNVDPIPGWRGVHGANRYTAEELDLLLSGGHKVEVQTQRHNNQELISGTIYAGKRGKIRQNRLGPDSRIDFTAMTRKSYPLSITVGSGKLEHGIYETQIVVDRIPRLAVGYDFDGHNVHVTSFSSLGDPEHAGIEPMTPREVLLDGEGAKVKPNVVPTVYPAPVTDADWDSRDTEGKWALFKAATMKADFVAAAWVQYLDKRKDYEFLEFIGLYELDAMKSYNIGWTLAAANAPQWVRAAAWSRRTPQTLGHGEAQAKSILRSHNPRVAYTWLSKYRNSFEGTKSPAEKDFEYLLKRGLKQANIDSFLGPHKPAEVMRFLDAPAKLADFGNRKKAEPGTVYTQQVLRAIDGMVVSGHYEEPWIGKVLALTKHSNEDVRQAAFLAFTYFHAKLTPDKLPLTEFETVIGDMDESAKVREAATVAYLSFNHPAIYSQLHVIARQPSHPGWRSAVSRLQAFGNQFTLNQLDGLETKIPKQDQKLLQDSVAYIKKRMANIDKSKEPPNKYLVIQYLERAAWAEFTNQPMSNELTEWTITDLASRTTKSSAKTVLFISKNYEPRWTTKDQKSALQKRVRELASNVIDEWKANIRR